MTLELSNPQQNRFDIGFNNADYRVWETTQTSFETIAAVDRRSLNVNDEEHRPVRLEAAAITPSAFDVLRVTPFLGRAMVEADAQTLADLVAATSLHVEEVARNPYHLSLPAWMQDNVRRGGELVGGQGGAVPDFAFATLYRVSKWENGELLHALEKNRMLAMNDNLKEII